MIKYLYREGDKACTKEPLEFRIDGVISGEVRKVYGGYQYFLDGSIHGSNIYSSVSDVQENLRDTFA